MPLENIRDKIDGNECDLSLSDLTTVPVKELVRVSLLSPDSLTRPHQHFAISRCHLEPLFF